MAGIDSLEGTLYYQWLINNNSTSTMLNAISGADSVNGISNGLGGLGSLGSIGSVDTTGSSFSSILQRYLSGVNATESLTAATMTEKLSGVLEEAAKTEDTNSLSYQTVQELYEYFSKQVSAKANSLLGNSSIGESVASSLLGKDGAASKSSENKGVQSSASGILSQVDEMNARIMKGQEIDFSKIDAMVDSAFAESMPVR